MNATEAEVDTKALEAALDAKPHNAPVRYFLNPNGYLKPDDVRELMAAAIRAYLSTLQVQTSEAVRDKLIERVDAIIETLQFNSRHMIAEDSLQDAWKMLDLAREQWATDANTWIAFREELRRSLSSERREGP